MNMSTKHLLMATAFLLFLADPSRFVRAETTALSETQKIEALIRRVGDSKDLKFVRNGAAYNGDTAVAFLRRKWQANDSKVKTARDFIDKIASFSGTSGQPYLIRLSDGTQLKSRDFLLSELRRIEDAVNNKAP